MPSARRVSPPRHRPFPCPFHDFVHLSSLAPCLRPLDSMSMSSLAFAKTLQWGCGVGADRKLAIRQLLLGLDFWKFSAAELHTSPADLVTNPIPRGASAKTLPKLQRPACLDGFFAKAAAFSSRSLGAAQAAQACFVLVLPALPLPFIPRPLTLLPSEAKSHRDLGTWSLT